MATLTSRNLNKSDRFQSMTIKDAIENIFDANDKGKSGYYKISISNLTWTDGQGSASTPINPGKLTIQPARYSFKNDLKLKDAVVMTSTQGSETYAPTKDYYISVNEGFIGPSGVQNGDGSIDLIKVMIELPSNFDGVGCTVTITYTVTWTEVLESSITTSDLTANLAVNDDEPTDITMVKNLVATAAGKSGIIQILIGSIAVTSVFRTKQHTTPILTVANQVTPGSPGRIKRMIQHPLSDDTYTRAYSRKNRMYICAVNNGKIDANGNQRDDGNFVPVGIALARGNYGLGGQVNLVLTYKSKEVYVTANWP
jgi:hypothetical protein